MLPAFNERYLAILYKRIENSNEYETTPSLAFKCRVANNKEKSSYQPIQGLKSDNVGIYIYSTRLPSDIKVNDRIVFLGTEHLVESVGIFVNEANNLNGDLSLEAIIDRCPKGIKLV